MNHSEDELQKELSKLKPSASLDPQEKESMKRMIRKHARKQRKWEKLKKTTIWFSTAAALVICGVLVWSTINNNQSVLPADDHDQSETNERAGEEGKEPADSGQEENTDDSTDDSQETQELSVSEQGTETQTMTKEGMTEDVAVTNYELEPYGIHYQMADFLSNYHVEDTSVKHYSDADNAWVSLEVLENTNLDEVVPDIQSEYTDEYVYTEEPSDTSQDENPYQGVRQHFSDPPQGYYAYQIGDNVLLIQYEYVIEAGDGMGPVLHALRKSIE